MWVKKTKGGRVSNLSNFKKGVDKVTKNRKIIIISIIAILILIPTIYFLNQNPDENIEDSSFDFVLDPDAVEGGIQHRSREEVEEELNKKVEDGMINISMNMIPVFKDGTSEGNLLIVNEEINKYPQVVEIYRADTDELIYKSGGIPVGSKIEYAKLSSDLEKGTYDCIAYFNAIDPEANELIGRAGAKITIIVEG